MTRTTLLVILVTGCIACRPVSTRDPLEGIPVYTAKDLTDSVFTAGIEGPAVDAGGLVYAVNYYAEGTIGFIQPDGQAGLFVQLPAGSTGNGIRFDQRGDMLVADYTGHNILRVSLVSHMTERWAHNDSLHQPNDLAIMDNGIVFLSDPDWAQERGSLWRVNKEKVFTCLETNMGTTNGIEVSPDNRTLYVNESIQRNVWAYDLDEQGNISQKRLLIRFEDHGLDGMRCDTAGNLYITRWGKGTVAIVSPAGKLLHEVRLKGQKPSNIAFGGQDGRTCYVTLQDRGRIEAFKSETPGREFMMMTH
ncbi:MAG: SMP-30/gluconolactonase/LRE family protein [Bacteroidia bacterium]|nr:SMP-30/gluconolactonase/LRE family protein [Bacteroidia bacterium]